MYIADRKDIACNIGLGLYRQTRYHLPPQPLVNNKTPSNNNFSTQND